MQENASRRTTTQGEEALCANFNAYTPARSEDATLLARNIAVATAGTRTQHCTLASIDGGGVLPRRRPSIRGFGRWARIYPQIDPQTQQLAKMIAERGRTI